MALTLRQIELLKIVKEYGPGTPEALAALDEYESGVRAEKRETDYDRRLRAVEAFMEKANS